MTLDAGVQNPDVSRAHPFDARYTVFEIKKRSGGVRRIEAPNSTLKKNQRRLLKALQFTLAVSPFSYGVSRGARRASHGHFGASVVVRIDISDFFTSVTPTVLESGRVMEMMSAATRHSADSLADMVLVQADSGEQHLPQGAPTSPILADVALLQFDFRVARALVRAAVRVGINPDDVCYTRYIDDLLVSVAADVSEFAGRSFAAACSRILVRNLKRMGLRANTAKTLARFRAQGRPMVTLGYSASGKALQVPRSARDRARALLWKVGHGVALTPSERGLLTYAMSGRLRIPTSIQRALITRTDRDAILVRRLALEDAPTHRDRECSVASVLARRLCSRASFGTLQQDWAVRFDVALGVISGHWQIQTANGDAYLLTREGRRHRIPVALATCTWSPSDLILGNGSERAQGPSLSCS